MLLLGDYSKWEWVTAHFSLVKNGYQQGGRGSRRGRGDAFIGERVELAVVGPARLGSWEERPMTFVTGLELGLDEASQGRQSRLNLQME